MTDEEIANKRCLLLSAKTDAAERRHLSGERTYREAKMFPAYEGYEMSEWLESHKP